MRIWNKSLQNIPPNIDKSFRMIFTLNLVLGNNIKIQMNDIFVIIIIYKNGE